MTVPPQSRGLRRRTRLLAGLGLIGALLASATPSCSDGGEAEPGGHGGAGATGAGGAAGSATAGTGGPAGTSGTAGAPAGGSGGASTGIAGTGPGGAGAGGSGIGGGGGGAAGRGGMGGAAPGGAGAGGGAAGAGGGSVAGAGGRGGASPGDASVPDGSVSDGGASDGPRDGSTDAVPGYAPCPTTAGTACAILPLGDSITEGYLPTGTNGGYRVELFRQAVLAGKNITFVGSLQNGPNTVETKTFPKRHEGHGGYTIDTDSGHSGISGSITTSAISNYHPHIVLLMIGTNDLNGNVDIANAPTRLGKLIDQITTAAPSALVVVATIMPIASTSTNQRVLTYNAAIPGLVSARAAAGKHVIMVDNYAAIVKDTNYRTSLMVDSLHPNEAGYAVLGRSFYGAVAATLPAGP